MRKYRHPYRIKKRKSIFKKTSFWLSLFLTIFFLFSFYFFFLSPFFLVKNILIFGEEKIREETIKNFLEETLRERFFIFSKRNIIFLSSKEVKNQILEKVPQIEEITVKKKFPQTLFLEIKERRPVALFCYQEQENCFFIDKEGVVFDRAEEKNFFKIFSFQIRDSFNLGQKIMEKEILNQILNWNKKLSEGEKIFLESVTISSRDKIIFKTKEGWDILVDPTGDLEWQLEKLRTVLKEVITPEKREKLEYIDLRFGNFANPKYR